MTTTDESIVMAEVQPSASTPPTTTKLPTISSIISPPGDRFTFPRDFPEVPEGVTIIPFKDFKERGIRIEPGPDDIEVDGLGVPTIPMSKIHDTDRCKTNTKRKMRKEEAKVKALNGPCPAPWWEQWEDNEGSRYPKPVNSNESRVNKFLSVAIDFKNGRPWPAGIGQQTDPAYIWTKLETFLGVVVAKTGSKKKKKSKVFREELEMSDDGDEDEEGEQDSDKEEIVFGKDKKALNFIKDPETYTKIFLSSYARAKGIIWSQINLQQMPRLVKFFLEFLIRSRAFPESETGFHLAIEVAKKALIELPLAFQLSADLSPEKFGRACRDIWGMKCEGYQLIELDADFLDSLQQPESVPGVQEAKGAAGELDGEVTPDATEPTLVEPTADGWVTSSASWGDADPGTGEWGAGMDTWGSGSAGAQQTEEENPWMMADDPEEKVPLPEPLKLTHTTGIVERSLRKIKNLVPIPANLPPLPAAVEGEQPDPSDVEAQLERMFPKIVLSPWLDWDGGEMPVYSTPTILETSQGPVVDPPFAVHEGEAVKSAPGEVKKHDPANDDITIYVGPTVFATLEKDNVKGMSIAGTWVQIVRRPKPETEEPPAAKKRKKTKKKAANVWYLDDLAGVFPSFWEISTVEG